MSPRIDSPVAITVAVPTFNGAERLPRLLEHLQAQTETTHMQWEILIVDNNSQDNTADVVNQYQVNWPLAAPLKYCLESRQGAAFARQRAIQEAKGTLVGFLDDDNLPAADWVAEAVKFGQRYPQAGAFSGPIAGNYEVEPPAGFDQIKAYLAIRNHGSEVMAFEPDKLRLPPAASLVVRKAAWLESVPSEPIFVGRLKGPWMIGGEDYEVLLHLHQAGWQILYDPALQTSHQISRDRFERSYLLRLARGCGLTTCQLMLISTPGWYQPLKVGRVFLGSLRRLCQHTLKYKLHSRQELATAFEFEFHLGSLLSPFFVRRWS
ncbi:MAG: hormogonium polysaccharide biosynthesis glycosyltransferase HpsE [Leptolyngbyaceae cyanobacterium]